MKITFFFEKTLKFSYLTDFHAKMVNIADLEYSADVISGMRQVLCFFPKHFSSSKKKTEDCLPNQPLGGP